MAGFVTRNLSVLGLTAAGASDGGITGNGRVASVLDEEAMCESASAQDVLAVCDSVRDDVMVDLGVKLIDQPDGGSEDPVVLKGGDGSKGEI